MKELSYFEFCEDFYPKLSGTGKGFLYAEWEITYKCNFDCLHCYLPREYRNSIKKELSLKEIETVMDKLVKLGVLWIVFSGGEPFMRNDFLEILKIAHKKGFLVSVMTNGSLINDEALSILKKYPPLVIDLPIFSTSPDVHDRFTRFKGSYRKLVDLVKKIKRMKIKYPIFTFKTILNKFNKEEIFRLRNLVNSWGFNFRYSPIIYPDINGDTAPCSLRLSPTEIAEIEWQDLAKREKLLERWEGKKRAYHNGYYIGCDFGKNHFVLDPYGYVRPCALLSYPKFKILGVSFLSFKNKFSKFLQKVTKIPCSLDCQYVKFCDLCPPKAYVEVGEYKGPVNFYCSLARRRYNLFREVRDEKNKYEGIKERKEKIPAP